jgi:hypothetical protein
MQLAQATCSCTSNSTERKLRRLGKSLSNDEDMQPTTPCHQLPHLSLQFPLQFPLASVLFPPSLMPCMLVPNPNPEPPASAIYTQV